MKKCLKIAVLKKIKKCFFLEKQIDSYQNISLNIIRHWRNANKEGDISIISNTSHLQERNLSKSKIDEIKPKRCQERKSAKARAQSAKIRNGRNQAKKEPRAQERKGAIGVRAEVMEEIAVEVTEEAMKATAEKNLALCPKMCYNGN